MTLWCRASLPQRVLYVSGLVLSASGLIHIVPFLLEGGPWAGPVSWRKPILFGLSSGITTLSMAWVLGLNPHPRWLDRFFGYTFSAAILIEVGLISLQTWRGEASHFNDSTLLNQVIHYTIDGLIVFIALLILGLTVKLNYWPGPLGTANELATRWGMYLLVIGCGLGGWNLQHGLEQSGAGLPPEIYGEAGVIKFAHGMPLHAIQFLPLLLWLFSLSRTPHDTVYYFINIAIHGFVLLTAYSLAQVLQGRNRFDLTIPTAMLFIAALALVIIPFAKAIWRIWDQVPCVSAASSGSSPERK